MSVVLGSAILFGLGSYYYVKNTKERKSDTHRGVLSNQFSMNDQYNKKGGIGPLATSDTKDLPFPLASSNDNSRKNSISSIETNDINDSNRESLIFLSGNPVNNHELIFDSINNPNIESFTEKEESLARKLAEKSNPSVNQNDHGEIFSNYINDDNKEYFTKEQENHASNLAINSMNDSNNKDAIKDHGIVFAHIINNPKNRRFSKNEEDLAKALAEQSYSNDNNDNGESSKGFLSHVNPNVLSSSFSLSRDGESGVVHNSSNAISAEDMKKMQVIPDAASLTENLKKATKEKDVDSKKTKDEDHKEYPKNFKYETLPSFTSEAKWCVGTQKLPHAQFARIA